MTELDIARNQIEMLFDVLELLDAENSEAGEAKLNNRSFLVKQLTALGVSDVEEWIDEWLDAYRAEKEKGASLA